MDLEPRERNPTEIRKTVFILIAVMIVGAFFVLTAYKSYEGSRDPDRPPISAKIKKNLGAKNQDGKLVSLAIYEGKVWFVAPVCVSQLNENKHALDMMKELEAHYRGNDQVGFALISIEGVDMGVGPEDLAKAAEELGLDTSRIPLLTTGQTKKQRGYIKDQLRLGIVSERAAGDPKGKWKFPSQIALVDKEMHLRQRYDFKEAKEAEEWAKAELVNRPELEGEENFQRALQAVQRLKETLHKHTEYILSETSTGKKE